jgi:outer membrane protein assembly factor BamE
MRLLPSRLLFSAFTATLLLSGLSGCSTVGSWFQPKPAAPMIGSSIQSTKDHHFFGIFSPYRVDIQQGNFVSREMVAQVRETMKSKQGMTQDQVRFVLGTPLVTDPFHENRWDYIFRLEKSNGDVILSKVTTVFDGNRLVKVEADEMPTEKDYLAMIAGTEAAAIPDREFDGLNSPKKPTK